MAMKYHKNLSSFAYLIITIYPKTSLRVQFTGNTNQMASEFPFLFGRGMKKLPYYLETSKRLAIRIPPENSAKSATYW